MKKHTLHTLLAAGVLLSGASVSNADEPLLVRQAQTLACLSAEMDEAFHTDLRAVPGYRSLTRTELSFRESLCQLATIAAQFRDTVDQQSSAHDIERSFACVQEAFACARGAMAGVPMRTSIRGMMQQFCQTLDCVEHINFEAYVRYHVPPQHGQHHRHDHHGTGHGQEAHARGIYFRVPIQQSAPFLFRQPIR